MTDAVDEGSQTADSFRSALLATLDAAPPARADPPRTLLMPSGIDKAALIDYLPDELVEVSWSCRTPITTDSGRQPCGACHACRSLEGGPTHR